jgi:hypothetical protein
MDLEKKYLSTSSPRVVMWSVKGLQAAVVLCMVFLIHFLALLLPIETALYGAPCSLLSTHLLGSVGSDQ